MGGPRGVAFARYLRKVHVEWCPFKPKALGPVFFAELHNRPLLNAMPKLAVTKALVAKPRADDGLFVDRARLTYACGTEKVMEFDGLKLGDILEEIDVENARIKQEEAVRGRPY